MKKLLIVLVLIIIALFLSQKSNDPIVMGESKIVVLAPLSDIFAEYGEEIMGGVLEGMVEGVEVSFEDTKCDPAAALTAYRKAVDIDSASFIIGPVCGSPQEVIAPELPKDNVVAISPSAATRDLFVKSSGYNFGAQYSLENESKFIAEKMTELGHEKVVLVSYRNAFSETHTESFKQNFTGEIVENLVFNEAGSDVSTDLAKLQALDFDAIYATDTSFFFGQGNVKLQQLGLTQPLFSMYTMELPAARPLVEGVIYSFPEGVGDKGAGYENSKIAAQILSQTILDCKADVACVKESLTTSGQFDEFGVNRQGIILKQIVGGEAVVFE
jgi:ABC-type branched-subunit amino acid transport system substrate-binding protein